MKFLVVMRVARHGLFAYSPSIRNARMRFKNLACCAGGISETARSAGSQYPNGTAGADQRAEKARKSGKMDLPALSAVMRRPIASPIRCGGAKR